MADDGKSFSTSIWSHHRSQESNRGFPQPLFIQRLKRTGEIILNHFLSVDRDYWFCGELAQEDVGLGAIVHLTFLASLGILKAPGMRSICKVSKCR